MTPSPSLPEFTDDWYENDAACCTGTDDTSPDDPSSSQLGSIPDFDPSSNSGAMFFPWWSGRIMTKRQIGEVEDPLDCLIWPDPNLVNSTFHEFGSGEEFYEENISSYSTQSIPESDFELSFWIHGVLMPIITIFGILANLASFIVLTRSPMRSAAVINIYLAALSAFDCLLLVMALLLYPPMSYCEYYGSDPSSYWCRYFFHSALITYPLSLIAQSGSVWTLTVITIDRFYAITRPLASRKLCTNGRALMACLIVFVWSILYNIPAFFELRLIHHPIHFDHQGEPIEFSSVLDKTDLRKNSSYVRAYKGYCYLIFMLLLPAGTMIVLNSYLTISVRKAFRRRRRSMNVNNLGQEDKERRCTLMAILVVGTFLLLNSLAFVNNMVEGFWNEDELSKTSFLTLVCIGNFLVATNSASNFFIYYALGLRFRQMLCKLFCCYCYTPEREYRYLSVYYGTGRNYCWTYTCGTGSLGNDRVNCALLAGSPGTAGGIVSIKSLPSIRRDRGYRSICDQRGKSDISVPLTPIFGTSGSRDRRRPAAHSTSISQPLDGVNRINLNPMKIILQTQIGRQYCFQRKEKTDNL